MVWLLNCPVLLNSSAKTPFLTFHIAFENSFWKVYVKAGAISEGEIL